MHAHLVEMGVQETELDWATHVAEHCPGQAKSKKPWDIRGCLSPGRVLGGSEEMVRECQCRGESETMAVPGSRARSQDTQVLPLTC